MGEGTGPPVVSQFSFSLCDQFRGLEQGPLDLITQRSRGRRGASENIHKGPLRPLRALRRCVICSAMLEEHRDGSRPVTTRVLSQLKWAEL